MAVPLPPTSAPQSAASTPAKKSSDTTTITTQTPDNVIGETLVVQGRVEFQNLLRIDGHFEGKLHAACDSPTHNRKGSELEVSHAGIRRVGKVVRL